MLIITLSYMFNLKSALQTKHAAAEHFCLRADPHAGDKEHA